MTERVLIVSNRLPVSAQLTAAGVRLSASSGGLATGLRPFHERGHSRWLGWPGDLSGANSAQRANLDRQLQQRGIVPVHLTAEAVQQYYDGFANQVLWPLFHYLVDRVPVDAAGWQAYREVNAKFADAVAREYQPNDTIWVHDYQLMLVPALLRERLPRARIGFFLHIPFPSSEVFRILPWRRAILHGLLGADLLGFHTFAYLRHFMSALLHVDGVEAQVDRVRAGDRDVHVGVFPMGVDAAAFATMAAEPDVQARVERIRADAGGRRIVLGIDRLDYTKGIPRRLEAVQRLLDLHPELRNEIRYIQVAVPSREQVDSYRAFGRDVDERVGRINGSHGTAASLPVHYIHQSVSSRELVALYAAADVMLVTPLRDGMNLVAKEFVASRTDNGGVLVLSEFAGAAAELNGAMMVNPYDVDAVADVIYRALHTPTDERRARMRDLRRPVIEHDVHVWTRSFLDRLATVRPATSAAAFAAPGPSLLTALDAARRTGQLRLLLDYDGTLVPLARSSELAAPDDELLDLLHRLANTPGIRMDLVSGRPRRTLGQWFGELPMALWAEHGVWHRPYASGEWASALDVPFDWMDRVAPILHQFAASTPGAQVEAKTASLAWHYRSAPREFGTRQARELRMLLGDLLSNQPLEVLEGKKVIEVRLRGVNRSLVAHRVVADAVQGTTIVAIGDDGSKDDLIRALPMSGITVAVGRPATSAQFHLDDYRAVRRTLRWLLTESAGLPMQDVAGRLRLPA